MIGAPPNSSFDMDGDRPSKNWWEWMQAAFRVLKKDHGSLATADRPTNKIDVGHYYFDTDLNHVAHYDGSTWRDGSGNAV